MNAGKAFKVAEAGLDDAGGAMQRAQLNLKLTRERLQEAKKGTDEYKLAMLDYRDAQRQANDTQAQFRSVARNYIKDAHEQNQADIKRQQVAREIVKTQEELLRQQKRRAAGEIVAPQAIDTLKDKLRDLRGQYAGLDAQVEAAQNRQATAFLNVKRAAQNLMANRVHISVQGWPDTPEGGEALITRDDTTSQTNRGMFEAIANDNGVITGSLRTNIADFHLLYRKNPRQQISFKPASNARPAPFVDYNVGDTIRARAVVRGTVRFDALFRVWGLTFGIDSTGNEDTTLELVMP